MSHIDEEEIVKALSLEEEALNQFKKQKSITGGLYYLY